MNPSKDELALVQKTAGSFRRKNWLFQKTVWLFQKLDWVFLIRFLMGLPFLYMAYVFADWFPAMFGVAIIATGIIAAFTKTGCGYAGGCAHNPQVETND
jgi:MFS superfamily sulfate permease-like transporter